VPDIFINDFLPGMDPVCTKIYIYCCFLSKRHKEISIKDISAALGMDVPVLNEKLLSLGAEGLIILSVDTITLTDLKKKEVERFYRPRMSTRPDDTEDINDERNQVVKSISDRFFGGQMSPAWYNEIDFWFEKYNFDSDVIYMLFQQCYSNNALNRAYVRKVAESWGAKKIKTVQQLENYLEDYAKYKTIRSAVSKKLRFNRNFYEYEEAVIEKWFYTYGYSFEIIEIALKKSVSKSNATLATFDMIISDWYKNGLKTSEEITKYEEARSAKYAASRKEKGGNVPTQRANHQERKYDDKFFDDFYYNLKE
jgi:DnaD/phage-associated family protein